jgi:hypothetical protein
MAQPIDTGVTTRYPAVALLCVNSADQEKFDPSTGVRLNEGNPSRIYINNQQPALFGYMTRLSLTEVSMEWATPNVNDYNNTLTVAVYSNLGAYQGTTRLTIPVGFYTAPRLGVAVANALNNDPFLTAVFGANTFTVGFGGLICGAMPGFAGETKKASDANFLIETSSSSFQFALIPYTKAVPFLPAQPLLPALPSLLDDLTNMMGITPSFAQNRFYRRIQGGYASMQYTPYVDIVSSSLTKNQNVRDGTSSKANKTSSILARVYLSDENFTPRDVTITYAPTTGNLIGSTDNAIGTTEGTLRREFSYPKQIQWNNTENVDVIDIEVLDAKGNPLFYNPSSRTIGNTTLQIENTADLFFTLQATEN